MMKLRAICRLVLSSFFVLCSSVFGISGNLGFLTIFPILMVLQTFSFSIHGLILLPFQKYRLHTRRLPPSTRTTTTPANQSALVLGNGLWMSHDQDGDSSKGSSSQSGSPQGPLQLATNTGGTSTTRGDSTEDEEDAKSEAYSWKTRTHKPGKDNV